MKVPYNWVGNKHKYMDEINKIVRGGKYNKVIDCFMGSGNILLNIECTGNKFIGNDKIRLLPKLYSNIKKINEYCLDDIEEILSKWNKFSNKDDYYDFRAYWNDKYKNNIFDKDFIYETALLLKMCSNSMVRFNQSGEFNQGFRGLGKKQHFFTETMKESIIENLIILNKELNNKDYQFINEDVINLKYDTDDLLILDPPYILRQDMYSLDFGKTHDDYILDIIDNNNVDFIYFNFLERDGIVHEELQNIINKHDYKIIELSNKTKTGQGASSVKEVKEIIITNIK